MMRLVLYGPDRMETRPIILWEARTVEANPRDVWACNDEWPQRAIDRLAAREGRR